MLIWGLLAMPTAVVVSHIQPLPGTVKALTRLLKVLVRGSHTSYRPSFGQRGVCLGSSGQEPTMKRSLGLVGPSGLPKATRAVYKIDRDPYKPLKTLLEDEGFGMSDCATIKRTPWQQS